MIEVVTATSVAILFAYGVLGMLSMYRFRSFARDGSGPWPRSRPLATAPRGELGSSTIHPLYRHERRSDSFRTTSGDVGFHALRATAVPVESGRWQLRIRAVLINNGRNETVLDDLHTIVYLRIAPTPPLATISYHGNAVILQDNTLFKESRSYSMAPGDGIEIDILTQVTRYEGAPSYYGMREDEGPVCVLFGLVADLYDTRNVRESRRAVPSDAIFLFLCRAKGDTPLFTTITEENAGLIAWPPRGHDSLDPLAVTLTKHREYRPELRNQ